MGAVENYNKYITNIANRFGKDSQIYKNSVATLKMELNNLGVSGVVRDGKIIQGRKIETQAYLYDNRDKINKAVEKVRTDEALIDDYMSASHTEQVAMSKFGNNRQQVRDYIAVWDALSELFELYDQGVISSSDLKGYQFKNLANPSKLQDDLKNILALSKHIGREFGSYNSGGLLDDDVVSTYNQLSSQVNVSTIRNVIKNIKLNEELKQKRQQQTISSKVQMNSQSPNSTDVTNRLKTLQL